MFDAAGSYGPILLGLGGIGLLLALVFTGLGVMGKRAPLTAWILMPMLILIAGAFGSWQSVGEVQANLTANPDDILNLSKSGLSSALGPRWLAHWVVAALCAFSAWGAGLGALIKPAGETRTTPLVAIVGLVLALLSPIGTFLFAKAHDLGNEAYLAIAIVSFAGVGAAATAFRRALHEAANRVAGLRFTSALLLGFTTAHAARAIVIGANMKAQLAHEGVAWEELGAALTAAQGHVADATRLAWFVFGIGLTIAFFSFANELGEVVNKFTLGDVTAALILGTLAGTMRGVEGFAEADLRATTELRPLVSLIDKLQFQLPASTISAWTTSFTVHTEDRTFGDIYFLGTPRDYVAPVVAQGQPFPRPPVVWHRAWKWNGGSWSPDATPLAEAVTNALPGATPLIVAPSSTAANEIVPTIQALGGEVRVLLRGPELSATIDPAISFTQARFATLTIGGPVDIATELYAETARGEVYDGVARYFGTDAVADKPVHRLAAALDGTHKTSLRLTHGENTRLDHLVSMCLATQVVPGPQPALDDNEEAPTPREGVSCSIVDSDIDPVIDQAIAQLGYPQPANLTLGVTAEPLLPAQTVDLIRREAAAIAYCSTYAMEEEGFTAPPTGRMIGKFSIDERGLPTPIEWTDVRTLDSFPLRKCVRLRIEGVRFPDYDLPDPPAAVEGQPEPEPVPPPMVNLDLTFR